jgi:hypothetical protein
MLSNGLYGLKRMNSDSSGVRDMSPILSQTICSCKYDISAQHYSDVDHYNPLYSYGFFLDWISITSRTSELLLFILCKP